MKNITTFADDLISGKTAKKAMPIEAYSTALAMGYNIDESFLKNSDAIADVMQTVHKKYDSAAKVVPMALIVEPATFGRKIMYSDKDVAAVAPDAERIRDMEGVEALQIPSVTDKKSMTSVYLDAIRKSKAQDPKTPIIGGAMSPFTLAGCLMGVHGSDDNMLTDVYDQPEVVHAMVQKVLTFVTEYISEQAKAGASAVFMPDPTTGLISPDMAREHSYPYTKQVIDAVKAKHPDLAIIQHNCRASNEQHVQSMVGTGADGFHFDQKETNLARAAQIVPQDRLMFGGLNPAQYFYGASSEQMAVATEELVTGLSQHPNFVPSSGCDIPPNAKVENIETFAGVANSTLAKGKQNVVAADSSFGGDVTKRYYRHPDMFSRGLAPKKSHMRFNNGVEIEDALF